MPTIESIKQIGDPEKRCREASRLCRVATERADNARRERDNAAVDLHLNHEWAPVEVYRTLDLSRSLFVRMVERVRDEGGPQHSDSSEATMLRAARVVERNEALADAAREVRDEAARGMLSGKYRKDGKVPYRNADVARCTGLTTARVAQLRNGTR